MELVDIANIIFQVMEKLGAKTSSEAKEKIVNTLMQFFGEGKQPLAEPKAKPKEDIEVEYSYYVIMYEEGKYEGAAHGFCKLSMNDTRNPRYPFSYAACLHKLKKYQAAIQNYGIAAELEPNNPAPWGHMADCYINMRNLPRAEEMIAKAIEIAGNRSEHQKFKEEALLIQKALRGEIAGAKASPEPTASVGR